MSQQHAHHLAEQTMLIFRRVRRALTGPGSDQIGKIHTHRRSHPLRRTITAPFNIYLVGAQFKVLPHIIKKQVDGGQSHRLRRKLIVRRGETDLHLLDQCRRKVPLEECCKCFIKIINHGKLLSSVVRRHTARPIVF